jgi:hypothetical protein
MRPSTWRAVSARLYRAEVELQLAAELTAGNAAAQSEAAAAAAAAPTTAAAAAAATTAVEQIGTLTERLEKAGLLGGSYLADHVPHL